MFSMKYQIELNIFLAQPTKKASYRDFSKTHLLISLLVTERCLFVFPNAVETPLAASQSSEPSLGKNKRRVLLEIST